MSGFFKSSIGRKVAMALSAFFLMFFLLQHLSINILSVLSPDTFNEVSHFMGTNPLVQFVLQPVLIFAVVFHLAFICLHFVDFWFPEMNTKFIQGDWSGTMEGVEGLRYHEELVHKFAHPARVIAYVVAFIFLGLHLAHGFTSAFQSMGGTAGRKKTLQTIGKAYSIIIPAGFIFIALYHHFNH